MVAQPSRPAAQTFSLPSIFIEGATLMRERLVMYALLAACCGVLEYVAFARVDLVALLYAAAAGDPVPLLVRPPLGLVLGLSLVAQLAIVPTAVARIEPTFRLTIAGAVVMLATIVLVGFVTDVGYALAVIPGIAAAVLLSQVLIGTLVRLRAGTNLAGAARALRAAVGGSFAMTRGHFGTTLGVMLLSLAILIVPFCFASFWVVVLGGKVAASLVATAPVLFLIFVYLECSRYALIVRWYRRLARDVPRAFEEQPSLGA